MAPTEGDSTSTVDFSFTTAQVMVMKITKITATIRAKYLKPVTSSSVPLPKAPPKAATDITVMMEIMAEPTPAQERARAERPSLSFPDSVKAGIIDQ